MKKRSACKILAGGVALGVLATGHCGQITLTGTGSATMHVRVNVIGRNAVNPYVPYEFGIGCIVCKTYNGPCDVDPGRDVRVTSVSNVKGLTMGTASGYHGRTLRWNGTQPELDSSVAIELTCDTSSHPTWDWVDVGFHRARFPRHEMIATATNVTQGITETHEWGRYDAWAWYPKWKALHVGNGGASATVRVTYPDEVVLRGKGSSALVLHDVVGPAPVTARIDKLPIGLACRRTSDGVNIELGVTADVGSGDSITCSNVLNGVGMSSDTLSVTAMIR